MWRSFFGEVEGRHAAYAEVEEALNANAAWDDADVEYGVPGTPSTLGGGDGDSDTRPQHYETSDAGSDEDYGEPAGVPKKKKGGYDSRIEQILYENPDLPILIVDAGKSLESGGKYIVYTIKTGVGTFYTE